jgi:hypothetical protein
MASINGGVDLRSVGDLKVQVRILRVARVTECRDDLALSQLWSKRLYAF